MHRFVLKTTGHLGMKVIKYSQPKYFNFSVVSQDSQVIFSQTDLLNELEQKRQTLLLIKHIDFPLYHYLTYFRR